MIAVFVLLGLLIAYYLIPMALAVSAIIRLALGWSGSRGYTALSGILALPQCYYILFVSSTMLPKSSERLPTTLTLSLAAVGLLFWLLATIRARHGRYWLEPITAVAVAIFLLLSVDNWIAH